MTAPITDERLAEVRAAWGTPWDYPDTERVARATIQELIARIDAQKPVVDAVWAWTVSSVRRRAERDMQAAFDTYMEATHGD